MLGDGQMNTVSKVIPIDSPRVHDGEYDAAIGANPQADMDFPNRCGIKSIFD